MTPEDVIEAINRLFDEAIVITDVGQHQMFTAQFIELNEKKHLYMSGRPWNDGIWTSGSDWCKDRQSRYSVISISGDGGMQMNSQELATAVLEEASDHFLYF